MARTLVFADNFGFYSSPTPADLVVESADWVDNNTSATSTYEVVSQKVQLPGTGAGPRRNVQITGQTYSNDQYAKVTVSDGSLTNANFGLGVRMQSPTTSENLYRLVLDNDGTNLKLAKYDGGTSTDFTSTAITAPTVPFTMSFEVEGNVLRGYINDVEEISHTDTGNTFTTGVPGLHAFQGSGDIRFDDFESGNVTAGSNPVLDPVPATAFPGQSRTVTGTGFGATQGTGGVTIGGVSQTITSWSDISVTFTTVLGNNNYGPDKIIELTTDVALTDSDLIDLVVDAVDGFGEVTMDNPNTTDESSVCFGATPTVVTGDQFEWEDFNSLGNLTIDAQGFVSNVDTKGVFRGRFWDATDSTWGTVEEFNATVPDKVGPVINTVTVPAADTYAIGQDLDFTINWDEVVTVTGTPQLQLTIGSTQRQADFVSGSGTTATVFTYTVVEGDEDTNGISVDSLGLNGGTIVDAASNAATLTLNGVENTAGVLVDGIRPIITVNDLSTNDTTPTVQGSAGDATSLTLTVNSVQYNPVPSAGVWSQDLPELTVNTYPMTLDGQDSAGNTAVQATGTLTVTDVVFKKLTGNMHIIRNCADAGYTKGAFNSREINYWQSLGATSRQYNTAQYQAENT